MTTFTNQAASATSFSNAPAATTAWPDPTRSSLLREQSDALLCESGGTLYIEDDLIVASTTTFTNVAAS